MDFWATLGVVARRWYVVVPMFLLAIVGAAGVYVTVPTVYESKAVVLLSTPPTGATQYTNGYRPGSINPLLNSGHGLDLTGALLIQAMRTPNFAGRIGVPGDGSVVFTVNNGTSNPELLQSGPFVFFTVDSRDPAVTRPLVDRAMAAGKDELAARQQALDAPISTFVNYSVVVPSTDPVGMRGSRIRAAGATGAIGLLVCLGSAFGAESLIQARTRRRNLRSELRQQKEASAAGVEQDLHAEPVQDGSARSTPPGHAPACPEDTVRAAEPAGRV